MSDTETLCKLYLELANVVPKGCISSRELKLLSRIKKLRLALGNIYLDPGRATIEARSALDGDQE
jgi:hypothetical protein